MGWLTDIVGRNVVHRGARCSVVCAVLEHGKSPAAEFWEHLDNKTRSQFDVLFDLMGSTGRIFNQQHFRHEEGEVWCFKRFQCRLACFRDGSSWVLTHGFVKKQSKWPRSELERANRIMREDKARILEGQSKGKGRR